MINKAKKVVIFSNSRDEHTHVLVDIIEKMGGRVYRVDTDRLSTHFKFHLNFDHSPHFICETPVGTFNSEEIQSVWMRRPFYTGFKKQSVYDELIFHETFETLRAIPHFFSRSTKVVDLPSKVTIASRKLESLLFASEMGLKIPKTLVTTSVEEAKSFISSLNDDVIVKAIDNGVATYKEDALSIPTSKVKKDADLTLIRNCPTLFQENVKKKLELRITVIGKKVFPVAFNTQHIPEAQVDFRKSLFKIDQVPHNLVKIPKKLEEQLLSFLEHYGLHYGAIDMALTPEGEYIFFELNPAGQFLWMDDVTEGLTLGKEMAKFLLAD